MLFRSRRGIKVTADVEPDRIVLTVSDHGPGIPSDDRSRVVDRFVRLERSRSLPGSGLGLSLVSAVARLHGGELRLEDNAPGLRAQIMFDVPSGLSIDEVREVFRGMSDDPQMRPQARHMRFFNPSQLKIGRAHV